MYKGSLLSVTLKKRLDGLAKPLADLQKGKKAHIGSAPTHASRLIVRNLPFDVTEQDLRAVFLPYGPIHEIHIPRQTADAEAGQAESSASTRKLRTRGFAFVWMLSKKDAEKAVQECNGSVMRAGTAQSLVSDKQKKKKEKRMEMKRLKTAAARKKGGESDAGSDDDTENREPETERVIAVDWALSKDRWKEKQTKIEEMSESGDDADGSDSGSGADEDGLGLHGGSEDDSDRSSPESEDENDGDEERVKPQLPHPETGSTVFIRNIPFDATEDELRTL